MKKLIFLFMAIFACQLTFAQGRLTIQIKDKETGEFVIGAVVELRGTAFRAISDQNGQVVFETIPSGIYTLWVKSLEFEEHTQKIEFPKQSLVIVELHHDEALMDEVVISSTRSSRTISNIPTRVEYIAGEELDEKANMKPGDIRLVLSESTGVQTQITSAASGNASIRIQGLDGRYTQILKDGLPLYSGAAAGLGLLQIPPLDLKRVELIKGSSSTLYGGGAIAGMVNLISRTPDEDALDIMINGTSALGSDISGYYATRAEKVGFTSYVAYNQNRAYDPSDLGFSAIPEFNRFTFNPRLFLYPSSQTNISFGLNTGFEERIGGNMAFLEGSQNYGYFERNDSKRISSQFELNQKAGDAGSFTLKNSLNYFNRKLGTPIYNFQGEQFSSFTEANYKIDKGRTEWIAGLNLWTENFDDIGLSGMQSLDYDLNTVGAFVQNLWEVSDQFHLETGLRTDYVFDYGWAVLPRISGLWKINSRLSSRLGGGLGYKAPSIFTEETERIQYRNLNVVNAQTNKLERSYGANWDVNYNFLLSDELSVSINQLLFYTYLNNPLSLEHNTNITNPMFTLVNSEGYVTTAGTETNVKLTYNDLKLFVGYTFTDTKIHENGLSRQNPLTPKHRINSVLIFEVHDKYRIGLEAYYFSRQELSDGLSGKDYWMVGFMAEKIWEKFSLFINFENFLDARQTRFDTIYTGSMNNPVLRDIYAPLEGFVINGGIKIRLHGGHDH